ncbi:MAG: hypothetical protein JNL33_10600 [Betaproteobacteria bacterium]|nr:hypothetical protein [Betaproteobacteria bacterium]
MDMKRLGPVVFAVAAATSLPTWADDEPSAGEQLVKSKCVSCHNTQRLTQLVARTPAPDRAARLERHLPGHFMPDEAQRQSVIPYLLQLSGQ